MVVAAAQGSLFAIVETVAANLDKHHPEFRTIPALNNDTALSRPRMPEWLDEEIGREVKDREEQEEIKAGFE